jgi:hypothetical protein
MTSQEYNKNYYENNKEKAKEYYKEYNLKNKTKNQQQKAQYYKLKKNEFNIRYQKFRDANLLLNNKNNKITIESGRWNPLKVFHA